MAAEKDLETKCVKYAQKYRWLAYKLIYRGRRGAPDRFFISPQGEVLFVEFKSKTGRVSALQQIAIDRLHDYSVNCAVCRTFDEFKTVFNEINP